MVSQSRIAFTTYQSKTSKLYHQNLVDKFPNTFVVCVRSFEAFGKIKIMTLGIHEGTESDQNIALPAEFRLPHGVLLASCIRNPSIDGFKVIPPR